MEDTLDVYAQPPDPLEPLVTMDEASTQLLGDTESPLPMEPGKPLREDYHYTRGGVQSIFMFFAPLLGWRRVSASVRRTREDWAREIKRLVDEDFPHARKIKLVCDNLNTHHIASLYETFPAAEAHRLARKLEIHYTPRNGSWLNVAEIELAILSRQCLGRRIPDVATLEKELAAWNAQRNLTASKVNWQFTTADARVKLRRLYPTF
jgi:DDE superfamily endonuclease